MLLVRFVSNARGGCAVPTGLDSILLGLTQDFRPGLSYGVAPRLASQRVPIPFDCSQGRLWAIYYGVAPAIEGCSERSFRLGLVKIRKPIEF